MTLCELCVQEIVRKLSGYVFDFDIDVVDDDDLTNLAFLLGVDFGSEENKESALKILSEVL